MRPTLPALLLVTLAAALLSGCAAGAGEPISMKDGLGDARKAAAEWGEDPELVAAIAIEPFERMEHRDEEGSLRGEFVTHLDDSPGDGRAPGWMYAFLTSDGRCVVIVLASGLGVLAEGWEDCTEAAGAEVAALPSGLLDSDEVADLLRELEGWPEPNEATTYSWELELVEDAPTWQVSASGIDQWVAAEVDALTGEAAIVEQEQDFEGDFGPAAPGEPGDYQGSYEVGEAHASGSSPLITLATPLELAIEVGEGATMSVVASSGMGLVGPAEVSVIDTSSGQVVATESFASGSQEILLEGLPEDEYTVRLGHTTGAMSGTLDVVAYWVIET